MRSWTPSSRRTSASCLTIRRPRSLARVTGVQVSRFSDEVTQVLVRGLPDVATTFNGRDIFTAENRRAALQDFPAGALAGLEVYKSGTADLLEPGLAGLINVRSRRPFDFEKGFTIAGGIRGTYNDQSKKFDPLGNLLISQRADTAIGEIGWLVNAAYTQAQYRNAVRWADGFVTTPARIRRSARPRWGAPGRSRRRSASITTAASAGARRSTPMSSGARRTISKSIMISSTRAIAAKPPMTGCAYRWSTALPASAMSFCGTARRVRSKA
ncbi:TonB-dependent receptor plug domain-containing protein [Sphingomonas sp. I4]